MIALSGQRFGQLGQRSVGQRFGELARASQRFVGARQRAETLSNETLTDGMSTCPTSVSFGAAKAAETRGNADWLTSDPLASLAFRWHAPSASKRWSAKADGSPGTPTKRSGTFRARESCDQT
jgi:hypothetical protein